MKKCGLLLMWVLMFTPMLRAEMVFNPNGDYEAQYEAAFEAINDVYMSNDEEALVVIDSLSKRNFPRAVMTMGSLYCNGIAVEQDLLKAKEYFLTAEKLGCPGVAPALAQCDMFQSYASRIDEIKDAAENGDVKAIAQLGWCYSNGVGVEYDNDKALNLFSVAADAGNPMALYELGVKYFMGYGVKQNITEAVAKFEEAARLGYDKAQYQMALMYAEATPLKKDNRKAAEWYDKAVAQNHADAIYNTALHYFAGSVREVDMTKSMEYLKKASKLGNANASYLLGVSYDQGKKVITDKTLAIKYYNLAYQYGKAEAVVNLGKLYMCDLKDYKKAAECFAIATDCGLPEGAYYQGLLKYASSIKDLEKKAKKGDMGAKMLLAECYFEGVGVDKNEKKAFKLMKEASKENHDAIYRMAQCYAMGIGVKKNYAKAVELFKQYDRLCTEVSVYSNAHIHEKQIGAYRQAATKGNAEAYFMLYLCYKNGFGVEANQHMAYELLVRSADGGYKSAQRELSMYWANMGDDFSAVKSQYWKAKYNAR